MRERTVGASGLVVGAVGLGTLTWGRDTDVKEAKGQLETILDSGGNFIDTSPAFGQGAAESCVGELLDAVVDRESVVLCTRAGFVPGPSGLRFGAGRGPILDSVRASLERLNTSYIDLLLVACPDPLAPDEETASALGWLIDRGIVRYIGVQEYSSWRAAILTERLRAAGLPLITAVEREYSLVCRDVEAEIVPMASHTGMGLFASSPLGRGVLTGKYRHSIPPTSRAASEHLAAFVEPYLDERARRIVEAVAKAADGLGRTPADVALSWVVGRPGVTAAIVGARTAAQLQATVSRCKPLPELVSEALADISD